MKNHYDNLLAVRPTIQSLLDISPSFEGNLAAMVPEKDVPILVGVLQSGVGILITLDRAHFLKNKNVYTNFPELEILTPGDFLQKYILKLE